MSSPILQDIEAALEKRAKVIAQAHLRKIADNYYKEMYEAIAKNGVYTTLS